MRKYMTALVATLFVVAGLVSATPAPAQAGPGDPPPGYSCGSVPISWTKTGGQWVGKMRLACDRPMIHLRVSMVITKNGGGAGTYYKTVDCYSTDACLGTFSHADDSGSATWRFVNEPTGDGTYVANSNEGKKTCFSGIYCGKAEAVG